MQTLNERSAAVRRLTLAVAVSAVAGGCPACPPQPPEDGGTQLGKVTFFSPINGSTITTADDADPNQAGIQVNVEVRGDDRVTDGTRVTLTVDTIPGQRFEATLAGRIARFAPTIPGGSFPAGRPSKLTIEGAGVDGEAVDITVIENAAASCAFVAPAQGATLRDDSDAAAAGFQADVTVRCTGSSVAQAGPVRLQVFRGTSATGTPVSTTSVSLSAGEARFQDVTLLEGDVTLQASVAGTGGGQVGLAAITVRVDTNRCDAFISAPSPQSVLTTLNTTDLNTATEDLDLNFTVQSALCPTGSVTVQVTGGSSFTGTLAGGTGTILVALPQGTSTVGARVQQTGGPRQPGDSPLASYTVDTLSPCASITRPIDGAMLTGADDEEMPPNAANGVTTTLLGAVDHPEGVSSVNVSVLLGATSVVQTDVSLANGAFSLPVMNLVAGQYLVRLTATDENGNRCPAQGQPPRQSAFSVNLDTASVTMTLVNDTLPQDSTLILTEDANPTDTGMQARVRVVLTNQDPTNGTARVRFQPIDAQGNPAGTPVDREVALAGDGTAELELTVPDGRYRLSVVVAFGDGRPSVSPAAGVTVVVDGTPPGLEVRSPVDGAQFSVGMVDVELRSAAADLDAASVALEVNGALSSVTATPQGLGVFTFASVPLSGAADDRYQITGIVRDVAGNETRTSVQVTVDDTPPVAAVLGVDRSGADRTLGMSAAAHTILDISTPQGVSDLDQDQNSANGLQYVFAVELPLADCATLSGSTAVLDISGLADEQVVTLTAGATSCRGLANGTGTGLTLRDGDGEATVTVSDTAGNVGAYTFFFTVVRQVNLLRIDSPEDGARVGNTPLTVAATSDLTSGTCELQVNTVPAGTQPGAVSMTFSNVTLTGNDGDSFALVVVCTSVAGVSQSLPVTLVKDLAPPSGGALVLASGAALPAAFNSSILSDGPVISARYLKDLAVEVDAEGGNCARVSSSSLVATPAGGTALTLTGSGFGFVSGGRCRSEFLQVDLGARTDTGTTTSLEASVTDSAGNVGSVGPASVLNDQVAPVIARVRPTATFFLAANDTQPGTPGLQQAVEYSVTQDGRATTAAIVCTGPGAACPAGSRAVTGASVIFGDSAADLVTLAGAGQDGSTLVVVSATDAAGNVAQDSVTYTFDGTVPVLEVLAPADGAAFNASADSNGTTPGFQVSVTVRVRDTDADPTVRASINGAPSVPLCTLSGTISCTAPLTVPQGAVTLVLSARDAAGNTVEVTRTIQVDSDPPAIGSIVVLGDVNTNGIGNMAEDGSGTTAGFQTGVRVTLTGAEDGRMLSVLTNNPAAGTLLGTGPVSAGVVTLATVSLSQGAHVLSVRVSDLAGNLNNEAARTQAFTVDVVAPTVAITQPAALLLVVVGDGDNNGTTPGYLTSITVTTDAESSQPCTVADANAGSMLPTGQPSNGSAATFAAARLGEGPRALTATCTDAAGNAATSAVYAPLVDTLAPRITMVTPNSGPFGPVDDLDMGTPGIQLSFTLLHSNVDVGSQFIFASTLEPSLSTAAHAADADGSTDVVVTFSQEGMHAVTVTNQDANGNSGFIGPFTLDIQTGQWNVTVTQPATSPLLAGVAQDQDPAAGLQTTISFTTNAPAGSLAYLTVNGVEDTANPVTTTAMGLLSGGSFSLVTIPAGENTFSIRVDSGAKEGNSSTYQVYVDLTPPVVSITQPSTILRYNRLGDATHLGDTQPADSMVQATIIANVTGCGTVARPGSLGIRVGAVSVLPMPTSVTADGAITVPNVILPEGAGQTLTVSCTDQGGNAAQDTRTITVDSVLPGLPPAMMVPQISFSIPETANMRHRRKGDVTLTFRAPGDDAEMTRLQAGAYELRFLVSALPTDPGITEANFATATVVAGAPAMPANPTTTETLELTGIKQEQFVFFGVRVTDDEGNARVLSTGRIDLSLRRTTALTGVANSNFGAQINKTPGAVALAAGVPLPTLVVGASGSVAADLGEMRVYVSTDGTSLASHGILTSTSPTATRCGVSVHIVPDLDNDGRDEVAMTCLPTQHFLYLWYGRDSAWAANTPPDLVLTATLPGGLYNFGRSLTVLDFDGDTHRDLVLGASSSSTSLNAPHVYILYGRSDGARHLSTVAAPMNLSTSTAVTDITTTPVAGTPNDNDSLGAALGTLQLADGDLAKQDLLIGAPTANTAGFTDNGSMYVLNGTAGLQRANVGPLNITAIATGISRLDGEGNNWFLGSSFSVGDFDGDMDMDVASGTNAGTLAAARIFQQTAGGTLEATASANRLYVGGDLTTSRTEVVTVSAFYGGQQDSLAIGAENKLYLFSDPAVEHTALQPEDYLFPVATGLGQRATVGALDINGDGFGDLVLASQVSPGSVQVAY